MQRRKLLFSMGAFLASVSNASAQTPGRFDRLLAEAAADLAALDAANADRERFQPLPGEPLAAQGSFRSRRSTRSISDRAKRLLLTFEVSSQQVYEARYARPVWPGGSSGATIGIGYDLGYATTDIFEMDWAPHLDTSALATLSGACGVRGQTARDLMASLDGVSVPWTAAWAQFDAYLPYITALTEGTFPNCDRLNSDCLGALVSLVYNRGPSLSPTSSRRREMRDIFWLMRAQTYHEIPQKIRDMKRLWPDPSQRGLLVRREIEAVLFEIGLSQAQGSAP